MGVDAVRQTEEGTSSDGVARRGSRTQNGGLVRSVNTRGAQKPEFTPAELRCWKNRGDGSATSEHQGGNGKGQRPVTDIVGAGWEVLARTIGSRP